MKLTIMRKILFTTLLLLGAMVSQARVCQSDVQLTDSSATAPAQAETVSAPDMGTNKLVILNDPDDGLVILNAAEPEKDKDGLVILNAAEPDKDNDGLVILNASEPDKDNDGLVILNAADSEKDKDGLVILNAPK